MATATAQYHLPRPDIGPSVLATYSRGLTTNDLDFNDARYPKLGSLSIRRGSTIPLGPRELSGRDNANEATRRINIDTPGMNGRPASSNEEEVKSQEQLPPGVLNGLALGQQQMQPSKLEAIVQYALPPDATRRVVERYGMDDNRVNVVSSISDRPLIPDSPPEESETASQHQQRVGRPTLQSAQIRCCLARHGIPQYYLLQASAILLIRQSFLYLHPPRTTQPLH